MSSESPEDPPRTAPVASAEAIAAPAPALEPEDYYYDGPYLVFTEAYHLRRGTCCQSGCRHCPYGFLVIDR